MNIGDASLQLQSWRVQLSVCERAKSFGECCEALEGEDSPTFWVFRFG